MVLPVLLYIEKWEVVFGKLTSYDLLALSSIYQDLCVCFFGLHPGKYPGSWHMNPPGSRSWAPMMSARFCRCSCHRCIRCHTNAQGSPIFAWAEKGFFIRGQVLSIPDSIYIFSNFTSFYCILARRFSKCELEVLGYLLHSLTRSPLP